MGDKFSRESDRTLIDPSSRSFVYDEVDDFEDEGDKNSLNYAKKYMSKKKESKEQVLGIGGSSSEEESDDDNEDEDNYQKADDDDDDEDSDDELLMGDDDIYDEKDEKDLDERAWGTKKRSYFGTDTTDEKILKKLKNKNEELARLEEETARRLQDRLAQELSHLPDDDLLPQDDDATEKKKKIIPSSVEMDLSGLSRSKKLQLLKRESPEFLPLIEDIKDKSEELRKLYCPLMAAIKDGPTTDGSLKQYIITKYRILYNYVTVLSVYMMTRCEQGSTANRHPVIARLTQYRQLLQELEPCDKVFGGRLEKVLADFSSGKTKKSVSETVKSNKRKKTLSILNKNKKTKIDKEKKLSSLLEDSEEEEEDNMEEKTNLEKEVENWKEDNDSDSDDEKNDKEEQQQEDSGILDADERRAISYKIQKNKGLMPSRKKDVRNPRVKYKKKYQTKLKRRKGQVREVRTEMKRYDGESTGIKSHLIKSIKIK
ncbi:unnamed protein product [Meganyctiphanes norvegica]|uniref:Sas10 C-terminal domain-containing protein n=1 Tax=Meganyctiphanes norvegica TaxID=48144 RepID=A0AAV2QHA1_MEGNR